MKMDIGTESIFYQGRTAPLPSGLIELFQGVIDYRGSLKGTNPEKVRKVHSYCTDIKFKKKIRDLVFKTTGIDLKFKFYTTGPQYIFAITLDVSDELKDYTGSTDYVQYRTEVPESDEINNLLKEARESLNKDTGKITPNDAVNSIIDLKGTLHFCVDTAFNIDLWHERATAMSAAEITAIVLHEINHISSIVEYVGQLSQALTHYTAPVKIAKQTPAELAVLVKKLRSNLNRTTVKGADVEPKLNLVDRALIQTETILKDMPDTNMFTSILVKVWISILMIVFFPLTLAIGITGILNLWSEDLNDILVTRDDYRVKTSDFKRSKTVYTDMEFRADEYTASYGLADSLALALNRMETNVYIVAPTNSTHMPYHKRTSLFRYHFSLCIGKLLAPYMAIAECHGTRENRYNKLKADMLKHMRNDDMPQEMLKDMLTQYRNMCNLMDAIYIHDKRNRLHYDLLPKIHRYIITGNGLTKLLINGKADEDIEQLFSMAEKMRDNELLYNWKRLDSL